MQISGAVHIATALFSCSLLAACGGGGGGGSSLVPGPTPSTTPTTAPTSRTVVLSDASAVLTAAKLVSSDGYGPGGPPVGAMSVARHLLSHRSTQAVNCQSGGSSGVGSVSFSSSTDAQGNTTEIYSDYYDASCAKPERVATLTYPSGSSSTATGTTTEYNQNGTVIGYATVQDSWSSSSVTVTTADSATAGGSVIGRSGVTCTANSGSTMTCGTASFATVAGTTTGLTASVNESFTSTGQLTGTVTVQATGTTYTGTSFTLVPPSSGTAWGLSGGTALDSLTGNGSATTNGSLVTSGNYTITDTTANITTSGSFSNSGPLTLTLTQSGSTLATIVVDTDGNGTITYADSTKQNVAGFVIFG